MAGTGGTGGTGWLRWDEYEWTAVADTRVHAALMRGDQRSQQIVCVHGIGCSHRYFTPVARSLASRGWPVVAPDLPGFGRTPGPRRALDVRGLSLALADWLSATGRGGMPLLANSMGCQVVVDMAVHAPELLGPVVLSGPTYDASARRYLRQALRLLITARRERPSLHIVLARDYAACGPRRFLDTYRLTLPDPIEGKVGAVLVPAVVVRGRSDSVAPHAWAQRLARDLPYGRLVEIPRAGHTLNWSAPEALARVADMAFAR
jgi:pimeloyl-ACP methyl ester carboxylesterase